MDQIQQELQASHPELKIQILGMNQVGHESGNPSVTAGRTLPWLQDVDEVSPAGSDNWLTSWPYVYRDVVIVDAQNRPVDVYNVTTNSLAQAANRDALKQKLIAAAEANVVVSWTNPDNPLDVSGTDGVSPLDVVLVINVLNSVGAHELEPPTDGNAPPPYLDVSNDGFVSPIDALLVINHLNSISSVQAVAADPASAEAEPIAPAPISASLLAAAIDDIFSDDGDTTFNRR